MNEQQDEAQEFRGEQGLPSPVRQFWLLYVGLESLAICIAAFFRFVRRVPYYPYGNPIFFMGNRNYDLVCATEQFRRFRQPSFWSPDLFPLVYPAPMALVYEALFWPGRHFILLLRSLIFLAIAVVTTSFVRALQAQGVRKSEAWYFAVSLLAFSYPFQLVGWLLNLEIVVWVVLVIGLWAYVHERPWVAAVCFGLAGSMKFFPIIYLGLLLSEKRYRQVAVGVLVFCTSLIVGTWLLGPTFSSALAGQKHGLGVFQQRYILLFNLGDNGINHSLFGVDKFLLWREGKLFEIPQDYRIYLPAAMTLGILLYVFRLRHLPRLNQIMSLAVLSILLPPISHDYTLIHLYAPFAMLILYMTAQRQVHQPSLFAALVCFAVLSTGQAYLMVQGIVFAGQVKAVFLCILLGISVSFAWPASVKEFAARGKV